MASVECGAMGTTEVQTSGQQRDFGVQQPRKALVEGIGIAKLKTVVSDNAPTIIVDHE